MGFRVQPDALDDAEGICGEVFHSHDDAVAHAEQLLAHGIFRSVIISEDATPPS